MNPMHRNLPIGIDFSGGRVRVVQCVARAGDVKFRTATAAALPSGAGQGFTADDAEFIVGLADRAGCVGNRAVVALPRSLVLMCALELPPRASGAPLEQIARTELARANRCDAERMQTGIWDLPAPSRGADVTHVIAAGVERTRVDPVLDALEAQGLEIVGVGVRSLALARAAAPYTDPDGLTCIVDANWEGLAVVLLLRGEVIFERYVETVALSRVTDVLSERLGLGPEALAATLRRPEDPGARAVFADARPTITEFLEALGPEVARSLTYVSHRYPDAGVRSVLVSGDAARLPGLVERVTSVTASPAKVLHPGETFGVLPGLDVERAGPSMAAASGLAMLRVGGADHAWSRVNLLPGHRVERARRRKRTRAWAVGGALYSAAIAGACAAYAAGGSGPSPVADELAAIEGRIAQREKESKSLRALRATASDRWEAIRSVSDQPDWSGFMEILAGALGREVALERLTLTPRAVTRAARSPGAETVGYAVALSGVAASQRAASEYVTRLEQLGLFDTVVLTETRSKAVSETQTVFTFSVACTLNDTAPSPGAEANR